MSGKKLFYIFGTLTAGLLVYILWSSLSQEGVQGLKGNFKEVALYRNENNTGPITRIYAVTLSDTLWDEMHQYGEYMPYTKYGTTKVYFFHKDAAVPQELQPGEANFDPRYQPNCLAVYEKGNMGQERFIKFPFRQ